MNSNQIVLIDFATVILAGLLSWFFALKYGNVAGARAARKFQEKDATKARNTALQSLNNEITRIRKVIASNSQLNENSPKRGLIKMPVLAFETAFVSGKPGLSAEPKLLDAITDYLTEADSLNSFIDYYHSLTMISERAVNQHRKNLLKAVVDESGKVPEILTRIEKLLKYELER